jgi:hypothetical protein
MKATGHLEIAVSPDRHDTFGHAGSRLMADRAEVTSVTSPPKIAFAAHHRQRDAHRGDARNHACCRHSRGRLGFDVIGSEGYHPRGRLGVVIEFGDSRRILRLGPFTQKRFNLTTPPPPLLWVFRLGKPDQNITVWHLT